MKKIKITLPLTVRRFMNELIRHEKVERVILFGSRAVKDNDERADVDIAISGQRLMRSDIIRLRDKAYHTRSLYWICLVHLESTPLPLRNRIIEQGVVLYEYT